MPRGTNPHDADSSKPEGLIVCDQTSVRAQTVQTKYGTARGPNAVGDPFKRLTADPPVRPLRAHDELVEVSGIRRLIAPEPRVGPDERERADDPAVGFNYVEGAFTDGELDSFRWVRDRPSRGTFELELPLGSLRQKGGDPGDVSIVGEPNVQGSFGDHPFVQARRSRSLEPNSSYGFSPGQRGAAGTTYFYT